MAFQKFITLSLADFTTLSTTGTVTINGTTLTYQPEEVMYLVPSSDITIDATTGSESISDGTNTLNVVTTDTAQNIDGVKSIKKMMVANSDRSKEWSLSVPTGTSNALYFHFDTIAKVAITNGGTLNPISGGNLGTTQSKWNYVYANNISDGTNTISVADLAALITYAKGQGWIS